MKAILCFLIFTHSLATQAQDYQCRKLNTKDYAYTMLKDKDNFSKDCFYKKQPSPETAKWEIELILDRVKEKCSYRDETGKRECHQKYNFTDDSLLIIRFDARFALVHVRHCSDPNRFFGVFKDTPGTVYGTIGIDATYFVECELR